MSNGGYFGIGIFQPKRSVNVGTLWRTAHSFGAAFTFQIGQRFQKQPSDTSWAYKNIPHYTYDSIDSFFANTPYSSPVVAVELSDSAREIKYYNHPDTAVYLLGSEDTGLPQNVLDKCHQIVQLPGDFCLNVAVAGSIVMYDRINKGKK